MHSYLILINFFRKKKTGSEIPVRETERRTVIEKNQRRKENIATGIGQDLVDQDPGQEDGNVHMTVQVGTRNPGVEIQNREVGTGNLGPEIANPGAGSVSPEAGTGFPEVVIGSLGAGTENLEAGTGNLGAGTGNLEAGIESPEVEIGSPEAVIGSPEAGIENQGVETILEAGLHLWISQLRLRTTETSAPVKDLMGEKIQNQRRTA